ncbi:hypothetical protein ABMZ06_21350 [Pseudomonas aeruginosa]
MIDHLGSAGGGGGGGGAPRPPPPPPPPPGARLRSARLIATIGAVAQW